jgi:hypothetical protein
MKNQYIGDSIDYVKYCLLRIFINNGSTLGVNWYLTPDNTAIEVAGASPIKEHHIPADTEFFREMNVITSTKARKLTDVEQSDLLPGTVYFGEMLDKRDEALGGYEEQRALWNSLALRKLVDCSLVYLDPDEGITESKSDFETSELNGFATYEELNGYYKRGQSVIIFQNGESISDESLYGLISGLASHLAVPPGLIRVLLYGQFHRHYYLIIPAQDESENFSQIIDGSLIGDYFEEFVL